VLLAVADKRLIGEILDTSPLPSEPGYVSEQSQTLFYQDLTCDLQLFPELLSRGLSETVHASQLKANTQLNNLCKVLNLIIHLVAVSS